MLIGFCGPIGVGKTTAAKYLADWTKGTVKSFADPLRSIVRTLYHDMGMNVPTTEQMKDHELYRERMVSIGDRLRSYDPDIFLQGMDYEMSRGVGRAADPVFIDDVRRRNEIEWLWRRGGYLVAILPRTGWAPAKNAHPTEREWFDIVQRGFVPRKVLYSPEMEDLTGLRSQFIATIYNRRAGWTDNTTYVSAEVADTTDGFHRKLRQMYRLIQLIDGD